MITFAYINNNDNVGDFSCCPLDYFDFGKDTKRVNVNFLSEKHNDDFVIIGGGGLIHTHTPKASLDYLNAKWAFGARRVLWGVGHNVHDGTEFNYPDVLESFDLTGIRDNKSKYEYVPCVSCMNPLFYSDNYSINHKYVLFEHGGEVLPDFDSSIPKMKATECNMEDAIFHLASGHVVITNSYHGAYWGLLLNKGVIVVNPFSTRFLQLHDFIEFSDGTDVFEKKTKSDCSFLRKCQSQNILFHESVMELYKEYNEA